MAVGNKISGMSGVLYIIKTGSTYPAITGRLGDFDTWTLAALGTVAVDTRVLDAEHGAELPAANKCAGIIVTGSHSMVTDSLPWSVSLEDWIPSLLEANVPFLGICYGHQLLARSTGGEVGFRPGGKEIGTVPIRLSPDCADDPLFRSLPQAFSVHAAHSQSVLSLPPLAVRLAGSACEPNHAFRIGTSAWGVQFHPEYNAEIMKFYIMEQGEDPASHCFNAGTPLTAVTETPIAARVLKTFASIVEAR